MRARFLLLSITFLLAAGVFVPAATAQSPKVTIKVTWEVEHEMILPETGRQDMGIIVEVVGQDFVCAQPMKGKIEISLVDPFAKWAGTSIVPKQIPADPAKYFEFGTGQPGAAPGAKATGSPNTDAKLNLAWDTEGRPAENAVQAYRVRGAWRAAPDSGTCLPAPTFDTPNSSEMVVRMMDKPKETNATGGTVDCATDPFQPGCANTATTNEGGEAPGPDVLIVLLGLMGLIGLRRRK